MEILAFIFGVVVTFFALGIVIHCKDTQPKNNVHFYVTRDKNKALWLFIGKPIKYEEYKSFVPNKYGATICSGYAFESLGLNIDDYKDLKWEDKPKEVFLNLEN